MPLETLLTATRDLKSCQDISSRTRNILGQYHDDFVAYMYKNLVSKLQAFITPSDSVLKTFRSVLKASWSHLGVSWSRI